jgi:D-serine deaminase-like pyridoxal phosphate-dependent protein
MALSPQADDLRALATPALVVDRAALEANIARMAAEAARVGVTLRPHAKTHKSPPIAALQLKAGAVGVGCATVAEAEAMAAASISGLLLTSPIMGEEKFARVAKLNRAAGVALVVDHPAQVEGLAAALAPGDPVLKVLVDIDVGQARTGATEVKAGAALAQAIAADRRLAFTGIQGYAGHVQHILDPAERKAAAAAAAAALRSFARALAEAGLPPGTITGSGTGTYALDAGAPYTELQPGSYVFMDADYGRLRHAAGEEPAFAPSLFVLATVISANRPGQITVDAGTKAIATNGPPPVLIIGPPQGSSYKFGGDEHGIITIPAAAAPPPLGARILIGATHCDPTVNLHPALHVVGGGRVETWPVVGRY